MPLAFLGSGSHTATQITDGTTDRTFSDVTTRTVTSRSLLCDLWSQVLRQPNVLIFDSLGQQSRELVSAREVGVRGAGVRVER